MARQNADPNNDPGYRRPAAWRKMKDAFGPRDKLARALERLEQTGHGCPRVLLTVLIDHFLRLSYGQQVKFLADAYRGRGGHVDSVTIAGRTYPVVIVAGFPVAADGRQCRCMVNHHKRRIELSEHVSPEERPRLLAYAVARAEKLAREDAGPKRALQPPAIVSPRREQLPAKQRKKWDRAFFEAFGDTEGRAAA